MVLEDLREAILNEQKIRNIYWPSDEYIIWDEDQNCFVAEDGEVYPLVELLDELNELQIHGTNAERVEKMTREAFKYIRKLVVKGYSLHTLDEVEYKLIKDITRITKEEI